MFLGWQLRGFNLISWTYLLGLILVVLIVWAITKVFKRLFLFILNSIVGLLALFGFNQIFSTEINITIWTIIITGVGGIPGFILVLILHFFGL